MTHEDIQDMATLRVHIDALDAQLIELLAERSRLIDRAAHIKARDGLPARIDSRVEQVAMLARQRADAAGLHPDLAEDIWRLMMEYFIAQEDAQLGGENGGNPDRR
ncbi:chorismate mutase [Paracoccus albus]|uniref:chorismate mutase n=1 Tax=Paracoccus albus TaxID=3017784 RepID=UPI0022F09541|nr:chorismate mutase [Paracoccus albus]WBU60332.1 chorismate mutase [Paracoccus albus]